ncbi:MAG: hypothetical protein JSW50_08845, partial [Candidatus Latescibacterota bacterium]
MKQISRTFDVARWEFRRFFKPRDFLWAIVFVFAVFLIQKVVSDRIAKDAAGPRTIAVASMELIPPGASEHERFVFQPADGGESSLKDGLRDKAYDGALIWRDPDAVELLVRKEAPWQGELLALLTATRQSQRLNESGLTPEKITAVSAPLDIETTLVAGDGVSARANKISALVMVVLMLV